MPAGANPSDNAVPAMISGMARAAKARRVNLRCRKVPLLMRLPVGHLEQCLTSIRQASLCLPSESLAIGDPRNIRNRYGCCAPPRGSQWRREDHDPGPRGQPARRPGARRGAGNGVLRLAGALSGSQRRGRKRWGITGLARRGTALLELKRRASRTRGPRASPPFAWRRTADRRSPGR